jgi:hypothetical protein
VVAPVTTGSQSLCSGARSWLGLSAAPLLVTLFLVAALVATLLGASRRVEVILALQGFVLTTAFGKGLFIVLTADS